MQYEQVWKAVDKLAALQGLSPSGLAKKAGLDSTTFNKSKRLRPDGKKRWPSMDSLNRIIEVSGISFEQFYQLTENDADLKTAPSIPFIKISQLDEKTAIQNKEYLTAAWAQIRFPDARDKVFAVDIDTNDYAPVFRAGTTLIVSQNSEIRRGDRVLLLLTDGRKEIREFIRRTANSLEACALDNEAEFSLDLNRLLMVNRILWASQ